MSLYRSEVRVLDVSFDSEIMAMKFLFGTFEYKLCREYIIDSLGKAGLQNRVHYTINSDNGLLDLDFTGRFSACCSAKVHFVNSESFTMAKLAHEY